MRIFRRKTSEDRSIDPPIEGSQTSILDLTANDAVLDLTEVRSILGERDSDLDRIEDRIEELREQGRRLSAFDPENGMDRRGSVETLDLREMMVAIDNEEDGVNRWFDAAFADEGSDTTSRDWLEKS